MIEHIIDLSRRFHYTPDAVDKWSILAGEDEVFGDCEDYGVTLAYLDSDRNMVKMWWRIVTFKYVFFWCLSPLGVPHAVLYNRGQGWTDNIQQKLVSRAYLEDVGYSRFIPWFFPSIMLKFPKRVYQ